VEQSSWNEFSASLCCVPRLQVSEDVLTKEQRDALPIQDSCKPLFVFYKVKFVGWQPMLLVVTRSAFMPQHKVIIGKIFGANAPEIEAILADNIFPLKEDE
jgi:hypothetical protein